MSEPNRFTCMTSNTRTQCPEADSLSLSLNTKRGNTALRGQARPRPSREGGDPVCQRFPVVRSARAKPRTTEQWLTRGHHLYMYIYAYLCHSPPTRAFLYMYSAGATQSVAHPCQGHRGAASLVFLLSHKCHSRVIIPRRSLLHSPPPGGEECPPSTSWDIVKVLHGCIIAMTKLSEAASDSTSDPMPKPV